MAKLVNLVAQYARPAAPAPQASQQVMGMVAMAGYQAQAYAANSPLAQELDALIDRRVLMGYLIPDTGLGFSVTINEDNFEDARAALQAIPGVSNVTVEGADVDEPDSGGVDL